MSLFFSWQLTTLFLAVSSTIVSIEWYLFYKENKFTIYIWDIIRLNSEISQHRMFNCISFFDEPKHFKALLILMVVLSIMFAGSAVSLNGLIPQTLLLICTLIINLKHPYGMDGADQIRFCCLVAIIIGNIEGSTLTQQIVILFICLQLIASYFFAGFHKLRSISWRNGEALTQICGTKLYGNNEFFILLQRRPFLAKCLSWSVILFEVLSPILLLMPKYALIGYVCIGLLFHLCNMLVMGLGSFFHSFIIAYPAVFYSNSFIRSLLFERSLPIVSTNFIEKLLMP